MKGLNEYWGKALYLVKIGNYIGYNKISELIAINKFTYMNYGKFSVPLMFFIYQNIVYNS